MANQLILFYDTGRPRRRFECRTPRWEPWESRVYERVFPRLWPILVDGLTPVRRDGAFAGPDVEAHLPSAVEALADDVPPHEQEAFLEAMYEPIEDPVGPIEPGCRCGYCGPARRELKRVAAMPRERRVRGAFVRMLRHHALDLLDTPNSYDRRMGVPRVDWRYRRTVPMEADDGSLD